MHIFLTGGSGFVGKNLIPKLIDEGHVVHALARSESSARKVAALGAKPVKDDLLYLGAPTSVALQACDAVLHAAAHMDFTYDPEPFMALNVHATERLLKMAQAEDVKHFVYISAAPVVADSPAIQLSEASASKDLPTELYPRTKAMAERIVLSANGPLFRTLALRPPAIWGPDNHHFDDLFANVRTGKWRWIGGSHQVLSTIHVDNLASAVCAALSSEAGGGEAYFVTDGDRRSMRTTFSKIFQALGIAGGERELPRALAVFMANVTETIWKTLRLKSRPPIAPLMIRLMATEFSVSDAKARKELGYRNALTFEEGLQTLVGN